MTRLIGAKSWLRGRSCALPTLDRRRRMPAQPSGFWRGNGRVFSCFFFSMECLPWIQISQDFIGLGFAVGTIQGDHALFACAPLYVPHVRRVFGEKKCHALDAFSNGPTNLDPFETQQKRQQVLELAVLAGWLLPWTMMHRLCLASLWQVLEALPSRIFIYASNWLGTCPSLDQHILSKRGWMY